MRTVALWYSVATTVACAFLAGVAASDLGDRSAGFLDGTAGATAYALGPWAAASALVAGAAVYAGRARVPLAVAAGLLGVAPWAYVTVELLFQVVGHVMLAVEALT